MSSKTSCVLQEKKFLEIWHELSILNTRVTVIKKQFNIMMLKREQCDLLGGNYVDIIAYCLSLLFSFF